MPRFSLEKGLELTILWYLKNKDWLNEINSGAYKDIIKYLSEQIVFDVIKINFNSNILKEYSLVAQLVYWF